MIVKKVQIFLCTKDIPKGQSGNKVYHERLGWGKLYSWILTDFAHVSYDNVNYDESGYNFNNTDLRKNELMFVIGSVSKNALWITEGMEFDENEVIIQKICHDDSCPPYDSYCSYCYRSSGCDNDEGDEALIKGPCGHFH